MISSNLAVLDWVLIGLYFSIVFVIGWWCSRRKEETTTEYFLAGRDVGFIAIGGSLFATNIGSEHLVGLAGTGADSGLAVGHFELLACFILIILAWVFVPFYLRAGVVTMPEFLERRYGPGSRWYLTILTVLAYVVTKISVILYAGSVVIQATCGISPTWAVLIIVVCTGIYTIMGGLKAVIYTDLLQAVLLIGASVLLMYLGIQAVGGLSALAAAAPASHWDIWKTAGEPHASDFPMTGILLGAPILGIWYWCTDQFIVQRVLSAKNEAHAKAGTLFAAYLKVLPMFIFIIPGICSLLLYPEIVRDHPDLAYPTIVTRLLPVGIRGIVIAGLLAALMSSLSSVFNSCSTLITWDFYKKLRPNTPERRLVLIGQVATVILTVCGVLWIPLMAHISNKLYVYLQSVQAYISPPIAACFLLGLLIPFLNGKGSMAALLTGGVVGMARLVLELSRPEGGYGSAWLDAFVQINFLHFAFLLFLLSGAVLIVVSRFTAPPERFRLEGLTFKYVSAPARPMARGLRLWLYAATAGVIAVVFTIWGIFR